MSSAIVTTGIGKSFGDVHALRDLDLDVPEGAFFVLLGPSGAGKTTTLRVIAGLEKPDYGTVHLTGIDATAASPAERDLAMVFQSYALYPKQTAGDNIASPLRARRLGKADGAPRRPSSSPRGPISERWQSTPTITSGIPIGSRSPG